MDDKELLQQLDLEAPEQPPSEVEMFEVLSRRIAQMLDGNLEYLLSILYRMDVDEAEVNRVLHPAAPEAPHRGLTRVVLARQAERNRTMKAYRQPEIEDLDEELRW